LQHFKCPYGAKVLQMYLHKLSYATHVIKLFKFVIYCQQAVG